MFGNPLRVVPLIALAALAIAGCDRGRADPVSTPPVSAVEVPAVPPETERPHAVNRRSERPQSSEEPTDHELSIDVAEDAGVVRLSATSDGGVRFWGTFRSLDGGFSFQGGFSLGTAATADAGPP
jgi:hypothetical protein